MSERQFHCFWLEPIGYHRRYECTADDRRVFELVAKSQDEDSNVRELRVVYGSLLEFEPYEKVTAWRIKD